MSNQVLLKFKKAGMLTTVQDTGRSGHQQFGVPIGGAMDKTSARLANELVGNPKHYPILEITMLGPEIEFVGRCQIVIAGADISPTINGVPVNSNQLIDVESGSILKFGKLMKGCRAYLAVGGKWQLKSWLGSVSAATHLSDVLTPDSNIKKGSEILIHHPTFILPKNNIQYDCPDLSDDIVVKVLAGPEYNLFSEAFKTSFFNQKFIITPQSSRMGFRLSPNIAAFSPNKELISSGVILGTIQITNAGQPIILMADAQTTGGYYRIANILSSDLDKVGQLKPGDSIKFTLAKYKLH